MKSVTHKSSDLWIRQPVVWGILDMYLSASLLGLNTTFQINSEVIRKPLKGLQTKYKVNSPSLPSGIHATLQQSSNKGIHQYLCLLEKEIIAI